MEMRLVSIPSQFDLRHTQIVASNGVKSMNQLNCLLPVAENHLDWPIIRLISERDYTNSIDFPFTTVVRFNAVTKILIAGKVLDFSVSSATGLKVSHLHLQHAQQQSKTVDRLTKHIRKAPTHSMLNGWKTYVMVRPRLQWGYPHDAPATVLFGEWFRFGKLSDRNIFSKGQFPHNVALTTFCRYAQTLKNIAAEQSRI
ncbi:hypothetical protein LXL04_007172 [Taraxacum kok-saghyz]